MKKRQYEHDYFNNWRDKYTKSLKDYIWPQLVYDTKENKVVGLVFETNTYREGAIKWPSSQGMGLDYNFLNINFCYQATIHPVSEASLKEFVNGLFGNSSGIRDGALGFYNVNKTKTFEDFVRSSLDQFRLSCVDIDALEYGIVEGEAKYVGIEGTHLEVPVNVKNIRSLLKSLYLKRFLKEKAHQLNIQKYFMDKLQGSLYLLIYNVKKCSCCNEFALSEEDQSVLIHVDSKFLEKIKEYRESNDEMEKDNCLNELLDISIQGLSSFKANYNKLLNLVCNVEI